VPEVQDGTQGPLTKTTGREGRGVIAAVLEDSHESWLEDAVATIIGLARAGQQFDADDLHREMRPAPSPKLPGIAFSMARKSGHITTVGYRQSSTKSRKNGVIRVWTATKEKQ